VPSELTEQSVPKRRIGTAEFHRGELHFRQLLEKLPAGAYTCDCNGLITYYNQSAVQLWGREPKLNDPADRFCGSFRLFSADGLPIRHDQCWMALALQTNGEYNGQEIIVQRPDGQRLTVLAYANPIRDQSGRLLGAVNVLVDISDRKKAEQSLRQADRAKDEFLATLAHELRNPLAPIRNAVEILRLGSQPADESHATIEVIERQVNHMTRLVDDLLDLSRIISNKIELRRKRVALGEVVSAAIETSRPHIDAGGHELTVTLPPGTIYLQADAVRLAQAISNLLNNAARYTGHGGRIGLTAGRQGDDIVIGVSDTGVGILPAMLSRIFEMFTQVDGSLVRSQGGLGIGLALARRLVELHGGTLEAQSDGPGKGSEFTIRLPIGTEAPSHMLAGHGGDGLQAPVCSLRILIADDNRDSANTLARLLRIGGNDARAAYDGVEAIEQIRDFRPDVALLDIGMPGMDGYETARQIRQQPGGTQIVLIAVTGWGQEADKQRARAAGFDHHMVKPLDLAKLRHVLGSLKTGAAGKI